MITKLPIKISPDPIIEGMVEIRFLTDFPTEAIYGLLYSKFNPTYNTVEKLPNASLPTQILDANPAMLFQPHFRLKEKRYIIQIGPRMLSVSALKSYEGWSMFYERIKQVFSAVREMNFIKQVEMCTIRYIDFFEGDIFNHIQLDITAQSIPVLSSSRKTFKALFEYDGFQCNLELNNHVTAVNSIPQQGSILDLATSRDVKSANFFIDYPDILNKMHIAEKTIFFSLLKEDYLSTLNPVYADDNS